MTFAAAMSSVVATTAPLMKAAGLVEKQRDVLARYVERSLVTHHVPYVERYERGMADLIPTLYTSNPEAAERR